MSIVEDQKRAKSGLGGGYGSDNGSDKNESDGKSGISSSSDRGDVSHPWGMVGGVIGRKRPIQPVA